MTQLTEPQSAQMTDFRRLHKELPAGQTPGWMDDLRRRGMRRFDAVGFPTNKQEEWRFTNVSPIAKTHFAPAAPNDAAGVAPYTFGDEAAAELVFVNGHFAPELSRTDVLWRGVRVISFSRALQDLEAPLERHLGRIASVDANPFVALNTGFLGEGAFVHVPAGVKIDKPIHLIFLSGAEREPTASHPRVLIVLEEGASASLVETYASLGGKYFTNAVTEVVVGPGAKLDHNKLQQESHEAYHVATLHAAVAPGGDLVSHSCTLGGKLTRNDLIVTLAGDGAHATLNGLVVIGGDQHCDNHTLLDHAGPNCPSHELYKHVLDGRATGVFKGKILVRQPAQKTDSKQSSKTLLLSDDAYMNSQPALEIYADDVKCTHGSTTGPVDEDMIFYLRTRGVSLESARRLLTYAFAADITRRIAVEPVRRRIEDFMAAQHGLPQDLRITDLGAHDEAAR